MSEVVTIGAVTATIYGTFAAATSYLTAMFGDQYTSWLALSTDDQKRTLVAATRFIDRQSWVDDYDTFAERDALEAFQLATYELAALVAEDASVIAVADTGSNIKSVGTGGAYVDYHNPTSLRLGSATKLPPILQSLIGDYLSTATSLAVLGGDGVSNTSTDDPFDACSDYDRTGPY